MTIIYRQHQPDLRFGYSLAGQTVEGILDDICQRLTQQAGVAEHHPAVGHRIEIDVESDILGFKQRNLTVRQLGKGQLLHGRLANSAT